MKNKAESPSQPSTTIELLRWKLNQFKTYGTDGCRTCDNGRVTLFIANDRCLTCAPETYEVPEHLAVTLTTESESCDHAKLERDFKHVSAALGQAQEEVAELKRNNELATKNIFFLNKIIHDLETENQKAVDNYWTLLSKHKELEAEIEKLRGEK
jgi:hypothetical protein